jgi:hypothetical protein
MKKFKGKQELMSEDPTVANLGVPFFGLVAKNF